MAQEQLRMTIDELFRARDLAKQKRSRRLAGLPVAKKFEIVEKFNAILREALEEDEQRRASHEDSRVDED